MTERYYVGRSARDPDRREAQIARAMEREHQRRAEHPATGRPREPEEASGLRSTNSGSASAAIADRLGRPSQRGTTRADRLSPHDEALRPERRTRSRRPGKRSSRSRTRGRPTLTPDTSNGGRAATRPTPLNWTSLLGAMLKARLSHKTAFSTSTARSSTLHRSGDDVSAMQDRIRILHDRPLRIYLQDHLAGAMFGVELVERCRRNNEGTQFSEPLEELAADIRSDRETLIDLMRDLGAEPSRLKSSVAWTFEKVQRLKPNGRLLGYTPLARVEELESLTIGITGKRAMWRLLEEVFDRRPVGGHDFAALAEEAEDQIARVDALRLKAAEVAVGTRVPA